MRRNGTEPDERTEAAVLETVAGVAAAAAATTAASVLAAVVCRSYGRERKSSVVGLILSCFFSSHFHRFKRNTG